MISKNPKQVDQAEAANLRDLAELVAQTKDTSALYQMKSAIERVNLKDKSSSASIHERAAILEILEKLKDLVSSK